MNPLQTAHEAVQARKLACGMPDMSVVLAGDAPLAGVGEGHGMWSGTDLREEDALEAVNIVVQNIEGLLRNGAATIREALAAAYTEGLLTGIEHGRKVDS